MCMYYCYCCCSPNDATTTINTNESDSDNVSKPWLSRMFTSAGNDATTSGNQQQTGENIPIEYFDMRNLRRDFNRPAGHSGAPGMRASKTGRKLR